MRDRKKGDDLETASEGEKEIQPKSSERGQRELRSWQQE